MSWTCTCCPGIISELAKTDLHWLLFEPSWYYIYDTVKFYTDSRLKTEPGNWETHNDGNKALNTSVLFDHNINEVLIRGIKHELNVNNYNMCQYFIWATAK